MAGHRQGTGRPTQRRSRAARARAALAERMAAASSPIDKVHAAAEFARSALTVGMRVDPAGTEHSAAQLVHNLIGVADRILADSARTDGKEAV